MPYTKIIVITVLLVNYSSASDIINPFADPSLILNSQIDYTQEEEVLSPIYNSSSDNSDIINPFADQSVILNSQESVIQESVIEESYSPPIETIIDNSPIVDNIETIISTTVNSVQKDKPTYQEPSKPINGTPIPDKENSSYNGIAPDIQGEYRFLRGTNLNVNKSIEEGYLVIEKLDETNFGYYYTFSLEKSTPSTLFGIFNYDKGRFHQRVIKNEGSLTTENLTNTKIVTDGEKLELEVNIEGGSVNILWEYDLEGVVPFKLQKSLKEAKQHYKEIYKDKFSQLTY